MVDVLTATVGIVLVLIATPLFNMAVVFQKMGLREGPEIVFDKGLNSILKSFKEIIKNKWWVIGAILGVVAWLPYVISIGLVGIMVSAPINSLGIIIAVIAANRILGEKIKWYEFLAIITLVISPIFIAFAGISNVIIDLNQFVLPLVIFLIILISLTAICFTYSQKKKDTNLEGFFIMLTGSFLLAIGSVFTNILAQAFIQANITFTWYVWAEVFFGIFWFDYNHFWVFLGWWGMAFCNMSSFAFYQSAFQKSRMAIVYPALNSIGLIVPIIAGIFVFQQTFNNYLFFIVAIFLIFLGTSALGRFQAEIQTMDLIKSETLVKDSEFNSESSIE